MKRLWFDLVRALLYSASFVLLWGYLALAARRYDRFFPFALPAWSGAVGLALMVLGGALTLACVTSFVWWGAGTPAPFDAPRRFVARGPYRFVRNPMYVGGGTVLLGYGLLLHSPAILGLWVVFMLCLHLLVVWYEEPTLERSFGDAYRAYRQTVRRWLPRFTTTRSG